MTAAASPARVITAEPPSAPLHDRPDDLVDLGIDLPDALLGYQKELVTAISEHEVVVYEKSRRIGATWGIGSHCVLTAGARKRDGGMDVLYAGYNLDMAREFVDTCAMWARQFAFAASTVQEFLFDDSPEPGTEERHIRAFRIEFASGFKIVALSSKPRSLRGRQGLVIVDEAAFHDEMVEFVDAALALLIWGGRVLVISTHFGVDNPFNELIQECRAGKRPFKVLRTTFDDALRDGLFRRVCLVTGKPWSAEAEAQWAGKIRSFYGEGAAQELDCVPRASGGKYIPRTLLEARAVEVPVLRLALPDAFVDEPEHVRVRTIQTWCDEHLRPLLAALPRDARSAFGQDFGRKGDLSTLWPLLLLAQLQRHTPFIVELRNVPFEAQRQIVFYVIDRLPGFSGAAFDATGNGAYLAEVSRQRWGPQCIAEVKITEKFYGESMPRMKSALEEGLLDLPRDNAVIDDFRTIEVVKGVPRVVERTTTAEGQRHGDSAIACDLAYFASTTLDVGPIEILAEGRSVASGGFADERWDDESAGMAGWTL